MQDPGHFLHVLVDGRDVGLKRLLIDAAGGEERRVGIRKPPVIGEAAISPSLDRWPRN